ncbi:glutamine synthetase, type I, partial [mine drainage metagenome]
MEDQVKEQLERIKKAEVEFLQLQFTDIMGTVKTLTVPRNRFEDALNEGVVFDGSSVAGYAQIEESDMRAVPDFSTYAVLPYSGPSGKIARYICNAYASDGKRFQGDPRYVLERMLKKLWDQGQEFFVGPEFEFFLFKRDANGNPTNEPSDFGGYFDNTPMDISNEIRQEILTDLRILGFEPEAAHHEVAYGQQEIDLRYAPAMLMADRISILKSIIKNVAQSHGLYASFMPKPVNGVNGSGMHIHQSIMVKGEKRNLFFDESDEFGMSKLMKNYLAGVLQNISQGSAILASWVNSYKRLIPGYEAPVYISWANKNRTALVRIPAGVEMRKRMELRCPDPAGNPYLQFATILGMGMDGIKRGLELPEPVRKRYLPYATRRKEKTWSLCYAGESWRSSSP